MTNSDALIELGEREQSLVDRFPAIAWTEPQPTSVGETARLTCRFCTALYGLKGCDVREGRAGFATTAEHQAHLQEAHAA